LGFTISRLLHQNLLKQNAEKILLIKPLNYRGDYHPTVPDILKRKWWLFPLCSRMLKKESSVIWSRSSR
jgi:hypothetical protein